MTEDGFSLNVEDYTGLDIRNENSFDGGIHTDKRKIILNTKTNKVTRPCPHYSKMIKNFSKHVRNKHLDFEEVRNTMNLNSRKKKFRKLMIKGISKYNNKIIGSEKN